MTREQAIGVLRNQVIFACERALFDLATIRCVEDALNMAIEALEERKTGKWIWVECVDVEGLGASAWKCSECDEIHRSTDNFCPDCGAKMEGSE